MTTTITADIHTSMRTPESGTELSGLVADELVQDGRGKADAPPRTGDVAVCVEVRGSI
jgi:hypothetical protein